MSDSTISTKVCSKCKEEKPVGDFSRASQTLDGYFSYCRACNSIYNCARLAAKRAARPAKVSPPVPDTKRCTGCGQDLPLDNFSPKVAGKYGRDASCRPCKARKQLAIVQRDRDLQRQRNRQQYRKFVDERRERARQWRVAHPHYIASLGDERRLRQREACARTRVKRYNVHIEVVDFGAILRRDGFNCHICGKPIEPQDIAAIQFDHVVPVDRGGGHSPDNIKIAHTFCNLSKGKRLLLELPQRHP